MKLSQAIELGKECGLETPAECVNNVLMHVMNLFDYYRIDKEVEELKIEANDSGIEFHQCGLAMLNGSCYMCEKSI